MQNFACFAAVVRHTSTYTFIHSFIPLARAECDDSLLFSGAPSIPLCYITFPSTFFHQVVFYPPSISLSVYFLVYLSALLLQNSYIIILGGNSIFFHSLYINPEAKQAVEFGRQPSCCFTNYSRKCVLFKGHLPQIRFSVYTKSRKFCSDFGSSRDRHVSITDGMS